MYNITSFKETNIYLYVFSNWYNTGQIKIEIPTNYMYLTST